MSLCPLILCRLLFLLRLREIMTPEILPLTLMHFASVCHSRDPWLSGPRAKQSHQVPSRATHSLSDINHPPNALPTRGVCELDSLLRQDPGGDLYALKPTALPCLHRGLSACAGAQGSDCGYSWSPAAVGPQHRELTLALPYFCRAPPSPWRFLYEQANVAPEGKVQTVLCEHADENWSLL